jgi:hypothetical protein
MALFLDIHDLDALGAEAFLTSWSARANDGIRCLKHWVGEDGRSVALLVEAPNEDSLRACDRDARELTELFAPAERWLSYDSIEMA